jgi:multicomponent Na+:H+ antiporter subunit G
MGLDLLLSVVLVSGGAFFFLAGTLGLLRFPDLLTRIHALTKADNVGLGLVVAGLAVLADNAFVLGQLLLIWLLVLLSSASAAHVLARHALRLQRLKGRERGS